MTFKQPVMIWGAGDSGRAAYYELKKSCHVLGFYDSDVRKVGRPIVDGKTVYEYPANKAFIVIACQRWREVSMVLQQKELLPVRSYLPYHMLMMKQLRLEELLDCFGVENVMIYLNEIKKSKKIALIYGNCQTEILANMIEYNEEFCSQYILLRVPQIHLYRDEDQINEIFYKNDIMSIVDLFLYQNVKRENRFSPQLSSDLIISQMSDNCKKLSIHNIYFDGYFIQYDANDDRYFQNMDEQDFPYTDEIVDSFVKEGKTNDEIVEYVFDENLIDGDKIRNKCVDSLNRLKEREKMVDVPIVDYITSNYLNEQLFYTYNHPKNIVLYEYVKRIFAAIGIAKMDRFTEEELNLEFGNLRINNFPIYPCVIQALGLKKYESKMRISHISSKLITMKAYIREYLTRCYQRE